MGKNIARQFTEIPEYMKKYPTEAWIKEFEYTDTQCAGQYSKPQLEIRIINLPASVCTTT